MKRFLKIGAISVFVLAAGVLIYWHTLKSTPEYSLALIVDAARRDDRDLVRELVDTDAVVEDVLPQVIEKAVEIYGRGLRPDVIEKTKAAATPLMPAVKDRARLELPVMVRRETERFGNVWFPLMVLGAGRYLDIRTDGDTALVKAKDPERKTEVRMQRDGSRWKIVGVKDDKLASQVAQRVGQEIIAISMNPDKNKNKNLDSLIEQLKKARE